MLTTPESLHLMLAQKEYPKIFQGLQVVVIDEWHELLGTKRGVQVELGLSRLKGVCGGERGAGSGENSEVGSGWRGAGSGENSLGITLDVKSALSSHMPQTSYHSLLPATNSMLSTLSDTHRSTLPTPRFSLRIWGISATIGNLEQAAEVLLGNDFPADQTRMVTGEPG